MLMVRLTNSPSVIKPVPLITIQTNARGATYTMGGAMLELGKVRQLFQMVSQYVGRVMRNVIPVVRLGGLGLIVVQQRDFFMKV